MVFCLGGVFRSLGFARSYSQAIGAGLLQACFIALSLLSAFLPLILAQLEVRFFITEFHVCLGRLPQLRFVVCFAVVSVAFSLPVDFGAAFHRRTPLDFWHNLRFVSFRRDGTVPP